MNDYSSTCIAPCSVRPQNIDNFHLVTGSVSSQFKLALPVALLSSELSSLLLVFMSETKVSLVVFRSSAEHLNENGRRGGCLFITFSTVGSTKASVLCIAWDWKQLQHIYGV